MKFFCNRQKVNAKCHMHWYTWERKQMSSVTMASVAKTKLWELHLPFQPQPGDSRRFRYRGGEGVSQKAWGAEPRAGAKAAGRQERGARGGKTCLTHVYHKRHHLWPCFSIQTHQPVVRISLAFSVRQRRWILYSNRMRLPVFLTPSPPSDSPDLVLSLVPVCPHAQSSRLVLPWYLPTCLAVSHLRFPRELPSCPAAVLPSHILQGAEHTRFLLAASHFLVLCDPAFVTPPLIMPRDMWQWPPHSMTHGHVAAYQSAPLEHA